MFRMRVGYDMGRSPLSPNTAIASVAWLLYFAELQAAPSGHPQGVGGLEIFFCYSLLHRQPYKTAMPFWILDLRFWIGGIADRICEFVGAFRETPLQQMETNW
ncbi:hypothetical protein H6G89_11830 [Oscillatoria sp. FACHB-1407]|uniref:hypothetical protein n=1 Tax=Oscillatoria sp. FACHB-1407 TaxID=2692847 RepID=UPI001688023B|nr:hypothetical protein [Oscillatoria sp. FACHB-1407]MBD2461742.1 hypothetical protein [Oscillatoria sp. FACHB-1407]